jgi:periplasmic protein TonB
MGLVQRQPLSALHGPHLSGWITLSLLAHLLVLSAAGGISPRPAPYLHPLMTVEIRYVTPETRAATVVPGPESHIEAQPSALTPPQRTTSQKTANANAAHQTAIEPPPASDSYFGIREVDVGAEPANDVLLRYPWIEYRQRVGGVVRISLLINEHGDLDKVSVVDSVPPGIFEEAALEAVNKLRFIPAQKNGRAVKSQKTIAVVFDPAGRFNPPAPM